MGELLGLATDSPADEYDREVAARRAEAIAKLKSFAAWWIALHPFGLYVLCGGVANIGQPAALTGAGCPWVVFCCRPSVWPPSPSVSERCCW